MPTGNKSYLASCSPISCSELTEEGRVSKLGSNMLFRIFSVRLKKIQPDLQGTAGDSTNPTQDSSSLLDIATAANIMSFPNRFSIHRSGGGVLLVILYTYYTYIHIHYLPKGYSSSNWYRGKDSTQTSDFVHHRGYFGP
mmetsp:Transcript_20892/g.42998  ORF Transcript_20892/g.42998 Transcript_20892/m.42998 type:complete len:139 (-) Transcript_20892:28-444(-)